MMDHPTTQTPLYQILQDTATKFIFSYSQSEYEYRGTSTLSTTLAPTCKRYIAPSSYLGVVAASHGLSNAEYEAHMAPELALLETWRVEVKDIVVDETKKTAVAWSDHYCTMKGRKEYKLEFMCMLDMDDTGDKINKIVAFIDTAECAKYMAEKNEVAKEQEGK